MKKIFLYIFGVFILFALNVNGIFASLGCGFPESVCGPDPAEELSANMFFELTIMTLIENIDSTSSIILLTLIFFLASFIIVGIVLLILKKKYKLIIFLFILSIVPLFIYLAKVGDIYYYEDPHYENYDYPQDLQSFKKAHKKSFKELKYGYSKDKDNVYYNSAPYEHVKKRIQKADPDSFEVITEDYAKDKNNVYLRKSSIGRHNDYYFTILRSADPDTFDRHSYRSIRY